jgi:hypothetical protein
MWHFTILLRVTGTLQVWLYRKKGISAWKADLHKKQMAAGI